MEIKFEKFIIEGLHGIKSYEIKLVNNKLILVGENGSGKTTILRILFLVLSGKWRHLAQYKIQKITIEIGGKAYSISHYDIKRQIAEEAFSEVFKDTPDSIMERVKKDKHIRQALLKTAINSMAKVSTTVSFAQAIFDFEKEDGSDSFEYSKRENAEKFMKAVKSLNSQILYLPTYRRIEQELQAIFTSININDDKLNNKIVKELEADKSMTPKSYVELIQFGMQDVDGAILSSLAELKEYVRVSLNELTLGYLSDVVEQEYKKIEIDAVKGAAENSIKSVLDKIPEKILSKGHKDHLFKRILDVRARGRLDDDNDKVICHYLLKLLKFQDDLRTREDNITKFCNVCNKYLGEEKQFSYDGNQFELKISSFEGGPNEIELKHLSSGEKQIVSLFSHLYLSGQDRFFVIIDEPELSLSVTWQRRFLTDILTGTNCSALVAATHSPFIYENDLIEFAHSIDEFLI